MPSLTKAPFPVDFVGNNPQFEIKGRQYELTGIPSAKEYEIDSMGGHGTRINIYVFGTRSDFATSNSDDGTLSYPIDDGTADRKAEIWDIIAESYYIKKYCNVTATKRPDNIGLDIRVESKTPCTIEDFDFRIVIISGDVSIAQSGFTEGRLPQFYSKYQLEAGVYVKFKDKSESFVENIQLDLIENHTKIGVNFLRAFWNKGEPYKKDDGIFTELTHHVLKCAFLFVDMQKMSLPQIVTQRYFKKPIYLLPGKTNETAHATNKPDWTTIPEQQTRPIHAPNTIFPYGLNTGETIISYPDDFPEFIHLLGVGPASLYARVEADVKFEDGTNIIEPFVDDSLLGGTIPTAHRIAISNQILRSSMALDNRKFLSYQIKVITGDAPNEKLIFARTYLMQPKPHDGKVFLLQNRYGLLESCMIDHISAEHTTEGEIVSISDKYMLDKQNAQIKYTAHAGWKNRSELQLIAAALNNRFNYLYINNTSLPIVIPSQSVVFLDENEDWAQVSFDFYLENPAGELIIQ
jgi:hypothetical protein